MSESVIRHAIQIQDIADELATIFKSSIPHTQNEANASLRHEGHLVALSRPDIRERINRLAWQSTRLYEEVVPDAHKVYASWSKSKQVRAERQLRLAMSHAGYHFNQAGITERIKEIRKGIVTFFPGLPMNYTDLLVVAYGLRALEEENKNTDETNPYWERIKGAVIIEPRPGYVLPVNLYREDGFGNWEDYTFDGWVVPVEYLIKNLVGKKVIFYPICTKEEAVAYRNDRYAKLEIPSEFEVRELDEDLRYTGKVIGKVVAEEFNPFSRTNSVYVAEFFVEHLLK